MTAFDEYHNKRLRAELMQEIDKIRASQTEHVRQVNALELSVAELVMENEKLKRLVVECREWMGSFRDDCK